MLNTWVAAFILVSTSEGRSRHRLLIAVVSSLELVENQQWLCWARLEGRDLLRSEIVAPSTGTRALDGIATQVQRDCILHHFDRTDVIKD